MFTFNQEKHLNDFFSFLSNYDHEMREKFFFIIIQVWTQKCAAQKASVDVNISYY